MQSFVAVHGSNAADAEILFERAAEPVTGRAMERPSGGVAFPLLNGVVYYYDEAQAAYQIHVGDAATGRLNFSSNQIHWRLISPVTPPRYAFQTLILDPLSLLLPAHDLLIFHGAAVAISNSSAVLLLANSGNGKSTLSFLLSQQRPEIGIRCLSDDLLCLNFAAQETDVLPIDTGFGLKPEILTRYGIAIPRNASYDRKGKVYLPTLPHQAYGNRRIAGVIFLDKDASNDENAAVRQISSLDALRRLLDSQTSIPNPYQRHRLHLLRRLSEQTTFFEVRYRSFCDINTLYAIIKGL